VVQGTYLGGTARQVRIETGDRVMTLDVSDISRIDFDVAAPSSASVSEPPSERRPALRRQEGNVMRPSDPAPAPTASSNWPVELAAGTNIVVRMIEGVDSEVNRVGQSFAASLDAPITVNGQTVVPRGADAVVRLVDAKESGKFTGRSSLTLELVSLKLNGRVIDLNTQTVSQESSSRGERTAKVTAGTAAVGAIIGAIAGGGSGAAIGAAAGGAAGAGSQVITGGQRVKVPSETRLTFVLDSAARF